MHLDLKENHLYFLDDSIMEQPTVAEQRIKELFKFGLGLHGHIYSISLHKNLTFNQYNLVVMEKPKQDGETGVQIDQHIASFIGRQIFRFYKQIEQHPLHNVLNRRIREISPSWLRAGARVSFAVA